MPARRKRGYNAEQKAPWEAILDEAPARLRSISGLYPLRPQEVLHRLGNRLRSRDVCVRSLFDYRGS